MARWLPVFLLAILLGASADGVQAQANPKDCDGCKDPALFSRMPGFYIYNADERDFGRFEFPVASGQTEAVEGAFHYIDYYADDGTKLPSAIQIVRNYVNAATAAGGARLYEFEDGGSEFVTLKLVAQGQEAWAYVEGAGNGMYKVTVVAKEAMNQDVAANAESLMGSLLETGRAAVYGIYFDTDKADIKPASEPAIAEVIKLLASDPGLMLFVVGHTDNVGTFDHNVELSRARAAAVVAALVEGGIMAPRLTPYGVGPVSPVASNGTDEGRAKNRRVELVAR